MNLKPFTDLLSVDIATVKKVFVSWGPVQYDAFLNKPRTGVGCTAAITNL
jgi:hypothetical protein